MGATFEDLQLGFRHQQKTMYIAYWGGWSKAVPPDVREEAVGALYVRERLSRPGGNLGLRVYSLRFRVQGLGFRAQGSSLGFRVWVLGRVCKNP